MGNKPSKGATAKKKLKGKEAPPPAKSAASEERTVSATTLSEMREVKAIIKSTDMNERMRARAIVYAKRALLIYSTWMEMAAYIKQQFDDEFKPTWHCIVGRNFGSYVTQDLGHFIYFLAGEAGSAQIAILLFRSE